MNKVKQAKEDITNAPINALIHITGYKRSSGEIVDIELENVNKAEFYKEAAEESLRILSELDYKEAAEEYGIESDAAAEAVAKIRESLRRVVENKGEPLHASPKSGEDSMYLSGYRQLSAHTVVKSGKTTNKRALTKFTDSVRTRLPVTEIMTPIKLREDNFSSVSIFM